MSTELKTVAWLHKHGSFTDPQPRPLDDHEISRGWTASELVSRSEAEAEIARALTETERMQHDVMELCLCEFGKVVPQPNRLYRPIYMAGCASCERLAARQLEAYGSRSPTYEEIHPGEQDGR